AKQIIEIVLAILQIELDWLRGGFGLADQAGIGPAATDIRKTADMAEHLAKLIRPLPGCGECADASGRNATDSSLRRIGRDVQVFQRDRQELLDQEAYVAVPHRIVFKRAIAAIFGSWLRGGNGAWIDEHGNGNRHCLL